MSMANARVNRMFEQFSSGYYFGRVYVEPYGGDRPVMQREQHERVNEQMYATGDGVERLDHPLVMKLENRHMAVHADDSVPEGTLAVPSEALEAAGVENPPTLSEVLLAKKDVAARILALEDAPV